MMRSLTGPAIVITIGILFLLHQVRGGHFYFGNTWPILLLVIGLLQLGSALASSKGHVQPVPPTVPPPPAVPPADPQPTPYGTQGH
jgi:Domain of unknown function (DUF5668)